MIDGEVQETTINGFDFKIEVDEGYFVVKYLEPKTGVWEHLNSLSTDYGIDYVIDEITDEASHWDINEE
jgi:hypothetical protein